jgi:phosphopantothenoylcysteine decarboxylase/phosphopantothenate--cysteine ligase
MLRGKKIILGVTGGIAAYKTPMLVRLLVREGAEVRVILTRDASAFVTPLVLSTVSGNPVLQEFSDPRTGEWVNHVELGLWADVLLIAPLTAHTMARMAHGLCDNLLMAVYLSARCRVMAAPAMDMDMWKHPATAANLAAIRKAGVQVLLPAEGELASGLTGPGRMQEPEEIFSQVRALFRQTLPLQGRTALVTAGPTHEPIDAVRYIGNRSSGKMGFALAAALDALGADVTLVTGPVGSLPLPASVRRVDVQTAVEMHRHCMELFPASDLVIMSAAVADFTPAAAVAGKLKKENKPGAVALVPTADILAEMGSARREGQVLAGFALETDDERANAMKKLHNKNLDLVVLNSLNDKGAGFGGDTNKVTLFDRSGSVTELDLMSKEAVAREIVRILSEKIKQV